MAAILAGVYNNHEHCLKSETSSHVTDYAALNVIGCGSYGVVYRAVHKRTGEIVAIKEEIHGASQSTLREIIILMSLPRHPSIVGFRQVIQDGIGPVYVVMEYVETDLKRVIGAKRQPFTVSEIKCMMKQILEGVKFLHENGVVHRDIKPSNILMNNEAELKICDFGLSRQLEAGTWGWCTSGVGTLWYKAPELLMGMRIYCAAVDMWSVGCIMGELVLREALFQGRSNSDQLACIRQMSYDQLGRKLSSQGVPRLAASGFDLLGRLLAYDPQKRITAEDALNHTWFREYYGLIV